MPDYIGLSDCIRHILYASKSLTQDSLCISIESTTICRPMLVCEDGGVQVLEVCAMCAVCL